MNKQALDQLAKRPDVDWEVMRTTFQDLWGQVTTTEERLRNHVILLEGVRSLAYSNLVDRVPSENLLVRSEVN